MTYTARKVAIVTSALVLLFFLAKPSFRFFQGRGYRDSLVSIDNLKIEEFSKSGSWILASNEELKEVVIYDAQTNENLSRREAITKYLVLRGAKLTDKVLTVSGDSGRILTFSKKLPEGSYLRSFEQFSKFAISADGRLFAEKRKESPIELHNFGPELGANPGRLLRTYQSPVSVRIVKKQLFVKLRPNIDIVSSVIIVGIPSGSRVASSLQSWFIPLIETAAEPNYSRALAQVASDLGSKSDPGLIDSDSQPSAQPPDELSSPSPTLTDSSPTVVQTEVAASNPIEETPTSTATEEATATTIVLDTSAPMPTPAAEETPTIIPAQNATETPSDMPTIESVTETPTLSVTDTETANPTEVPTDVPTEVPTVSVTDTETPYPTEAPTETATYEPPTEAPTDTPTEVATETPTYEAPTETPTETSIIETPTETPYHTPTDVPTLMVTDTPTITPTDTPWGGDTPTEVPTDTPTIPDTPYSTPTDSPTDTPTNPPTEVPTTFDTETPTPTETETPTVYETETPTPTSPTPECGNMVVEEGEDCDDGNKEDDDGCDSKCTKQVCCICEWQDNGHLACDNGRFEAACDKFLGSSECEGATKIKKPVIGEVKQDSSDVPGKWCITNPEREEYSQCSGKKTYYQYNGHGDRDTAEYCIRAIAEACSTSEAGAPPKFLDCVFNTCSGVKDRAGLLRALGEIQQKYPWINWSVKGSPQVTYGDPGDSSDVCQPQEKYEIGPDSLNITGELCSKVVGQKTYYTGCEDPETTRCVDDITNQCPLEGNAWPEKTLYGCPPGILPNGSPVDSSLSYDATWTVEACEKWPCHTECLGPPYKITGCQNVVGASPESCSQDCQWNQPPGQ